MGHCAVPEDPRLITRACVIPLVALFMLLPWIIRNYRVLHAFVPLETGVGDVLLGSYNRVSQPIRCIMATGFSQPRRCPSTPGRSLRRITKSSAIVSKYGSPN